jgi:tRNA (guanine37-N1)-methyltransferase
MQRQRDLSGEAGSAGGANKPKVVYLTPQALPIKDAGIRQLASEPGLIFLCGRYEGIDERLIEARVDQEVSIGDYVLSGGELAAMVLIDAMVRLLPGVLNTAESAVEDSFSPARAGLLDHPHYTRPDVWNDRAAPEVLMGGNHAEIAKWRHRMALERTWKRRPDLLAGRTLSREDLQLLDAIKRGKP